MTESSMGTHVVTQIAVVVKDIDKAIEAYSRIFGLSKPDVMLTDPTHAHATYRGVPTNAQAKLAFFHLGQVDLELIEPVVGDSVWQEVLDKKGEGVHHIAFQIKGTDGVTDFLDQNGIPTIQQGQYTGGMYTYVDSEPQLGVMLELLENFEQDA